MKIISSKKDDYILRLVQGEDFIASLLAFAKKADIRGAWFWAIGATDKIEVAFYDLKKQKYVRGKFGGRLEILGINGNLAVKDGKPVIHCHGIFGKPNYATIGGHIFSCRISATCEIYLTKLPKLGRKRDSAIGLNLLY